MGGLGDEQHASIWDGIEKTSVSAETIALTKIQLTLSLEAVMRHIRKQKIEYGFAREGKIVPQETGIVQSLSDGIKSRIPRDQFTALA